MYRIKSNKKVVDYSNGRIPTGDDCWPTIDMSHLKSDSLERRCTDSLNLDITNLRKPNKLKNF
jgi:hypothetical protein